MKKNIKIAPSILSADFANLEKEISILNNSEADYIHVDVMDGHFVQNLTFGPPVIEKIRNYSTKPFDVHLMIESVDQYLESYSKAGADIITIHPETTNNINYLIRSLICADSQKFTILVARFVGFSSAAKCPPENLSHCFTL